MDELFKFKSIATISYLFKNYGKAFVVPVLRPKLYSSFISRFTWPGGLPTLYYATLQLHNNAGKDIQLIESNGKEPVHLLTKGDVRKIKLIGNAAKHYKFEAVDNSTEESLVLNNQPFTSLVLGEDPDKVMDITISNPSEYNKLIV